ncbi:alpha/beta hydrolase fold protein [Bradyrhizobium oligotrophicum S58]|uniref:Alpha/beta hydrolase fold protein n=1 Tax=Bradyrhizobium oligotrophicum S58 TaxID=1245469 RepID=M4Z0J0_9BRAD|nr:alpha/beta hydrolase [Bradyrhizobium oligotrophicum]BAM86046.1 alpha/beta hydrolase fold protein [Bradyrhizobium oligotrophicum S58]
MSQSAKTSIVLLPGMDGTGELLRPLAERLSAYGPVRIIAYPADRDLDYNQLTAFVRERLPADRFVILGESFSGPIAIEIAASSRQVAGLILASSFARHRLPKWLSRFTWLLDPRWVPTKLIIAVLMGSAATPSLRRQLRDVLDCLPHAVLRARAGNALRVDKRDRLRATTCPMLCLHGTSDWLILQKQIAAILAARPDCELHRMNAPHMLLATHADAAAAVIGDFCKRLEGA